MITDNLNVFSDTVALSGTTPVYSSSFDLAAGVTTATNTTAPLAGGQPLYAMIHCDVALAATSAPLLDVVLVSDTSPTFAGSPVTHLTFTQLSTWAAGAMVQMVVPPEESMNRYVGLKYTLASTTGTPTVTLTAGLILSPSFLKTFAIGQTYS